jgi:glycerate kinase
VLRVVIAPDSFKGTATAREAAAAIAEGWREVRPDDELVLRPQADGGEGTLDAIATADPAAAVRRVEVTGPDGRPTSARWLLRADGSAVLELAESSAITGMRELDPLGATTRGLGETLVHALDAGATSLTIGLGGSASTDGGAGALAALGLRLRGRGGVELRDGGGALADLVDVDVTGLRPPPAGGVRLLTDTTAPLLGPTGAAAVFGPQKGADRDAIERLDDSLRRFSELLGGDPTAPGAGAAGGAGYGFATWGATIEPGASTIAELSGLVPAVRGADVVISGEGRFDATSLAGKVVGHVLGLVPPTARAVVIAGSLGADLRAADGSAPTAFALDRLAGAREAAMTDPLRWLREAGAAAARGLTPRG